MAIATQLDAVRELACARHREFADLLPGSQDRRERVSMLGKLKEIFGLGRRAPRRRTRAG